MMDPIEVVKTLLADPTSEEVVTSLTAPNVTYVSLNYDNPDLKKLMPWCGTGHGPKGILDTFRRVQEFWKVDEFNLGDVFGSGENVAVFGNFTYTSAVLRKQVHTPMAIFCKVTDGLITYMQFMEDTFATSASFRSGGSWTFHSDPHGPNVSVP